MEVYSIMAKRIVSGIFALIALGALGVILAGALTSGEQLIVRFLTAVTVGALGLYVISDLRLQNETNSADSPDRTQQSWPSAPRQATSSEHRQVRAPTFQALEPVTGPQAVVPAWNAPPQPVELANSRLIQPGDQEPLRQQPPHPRTALARYQPQVGSEAPTEPFASYLADTAPIPKLDHIDERNLVESAVVEADVFDADPIDLGVESTEISYSGPLETRSTEWPRPTSEPVLDPISIPRQNSDAVTTMDVPASADEELHRPDDEYGPVTVDELLGELPDAKPTPQRPHLTLVSSDTASRRIEAAGYAEPSRPELLDLRHEPTPTERDVDTAAAPDDDRLEAAIRAGEVQVVSTLIRQGMLTTEGPVTDRDVRTMVYVAFTSNELRKLIRSGGSPDRVRSGELDLGPVELFDERRYAPLPQRVYIPSTALPPTTDSEPDTEPVEAPEPTIDLNELDADNPPSTPPLPTPKHLYRKAGIDAVVDT